MRTKVIFWVLVSLLFFTPVLAKGTNAAELNRTISLGAQGNDVKYLQEFLARDPEVYPDGLISGYFGSKTEEAVKRWQRKHGIDAIGIVGPKTIAKIKEVDMLPAKTPASQTQTGTEPPVTTPTTQPTATTSSLVTPTATLTIPAPAPTQAQIELTPNKEVIASYEYGPTLSYGSKKEASDQFFSLPIKTSIENLIPSTTYQIRAKVIDKSGNVGYSPNYTFTTPSLDQAPLLTYGPNVTMSAATPPTSTTISWGTNIPCVGSVYYGATTAFGNSAVENQTLTDHSLTITGLSPNALYLYNISCATTKKTLTSDNFVFTATSSKPSISRQDDSPLANVFEIFRRILENIKF